MAKYDVLIVDDDEATRDGLRELLALMGRPLESGADRPGRLSPHTADAAVSHGRSGTGFRPEDLSHAAGSDASTAIAHDQVREEKGLRPGGFGLVLIRAIADELLYNEQRNEVVFVKYLDTLGS